MKLRQFAALAVFASMASPAYAHYISGYAVGNFARCGANNLPGTIRELQKFFASSNFPDDAEKNVLWTDRNVLQADWGAARDKFESADAASGFDGVDAGLISYIASHGVTRNAKYTALPGGADGCAIETSAMGVGDANARYLVLSTCQGLKIGNGDDPRRPGENPQNTWRDANKGLNCIFGYSNNMQDADQYGQYWLDALATTDVTLVDAFFKASRRVSYGNVPAVLCFGADENNARQHLTTAKRFTEERYGTGGSAYRYDLARRLDDTFVLPETTSDKAVPRVIKIERRTFKVAQLVKAFLGNAATDLSPSPNSALAVFRSEQGMLTHDANTGFISWQKPDPEALSAPRAIALKDDVVIRIASDFLARKGFVKDVEGELRPTYVIDRGISDAGAPVTFGKTVVFHQRLSGLTPLAAAGSVEVTVNAGGEVTAMTASLIDATMLRLVEWVDPNTVDLASAKNLALQHLQRRFSDANLTIVEYRVGYAVGDYSQLQERGRLTLEVLIEAEQGGFARRYSEKISL
jgi:hypothetical protein